MNKEVQTIEKQMSAIQTLIIAMDNGPTDFTKRQIEEALILIEDFRFARENYDKTFDEMIELYYNLLDMKASGLATLEAQEKILNDCDRLEIKMQILHEKQEKIISEISNLLQNKDKE